ncbi:MAG TPA: DUF928 domain-containing protein [Thiotrichales bacterium]|nr:DUF928 domain-containing protein [Thiotrichales bacterium]
MEISIMRLAQILVVSLILSTPAGAAEPSSGKDTPPQTEKSPPAVMETAISESANLPASTRPTAPVPRDALMPVYRPPLRGAPRNRVGGGTRGAAQPPLIQALAPRHVAHTTSPHPTLYWYSSGSGEVVFELSRLGELGEERIHRHRQPARQGIQSISLRELGVKLEPEVLYVWRVWLDSAGEEGGYDSTSSALIKRVAVADSLARALELASPRERPLVYARHGIWYEALQQVSQRVQQDPSDTLARRQRIRLLEQMGAGGIIASELQRLKGEVAGG